MLTKAQALIDASIIYGAQRFYDGVHDDPNWPFRYKYQKEDDHILFLEFMHYALLYDQILIEGSCGSTAATAEFSRELLSFIDHVNDRCPGETRFIEEVLVGESALPQREKTNKIVQKSLCKMIARNMECGLISLDKIRQIQIPWAYFGERHHDYTDIRKACMDIGLSDEVIPFSLFVWRALLYSAFARYLSMQGPTDKDNSKVLDAYLCLYAVPRSISRRIGHSTLSLTLSNKSHASGITLILSSLLSPARMHTDRGAGR